MVKNNASTPLLALASFASGLRIESCPDSVVAKTRALLLYAIAVGVTSARAPVLRRVAAAMKQENGTADAAACLLDGSRTALGGG